MLPTSSIYKSESPRDERTLSGDDDELAWMVKVTFEEVALMPETVPSVRSGDGVEVFEKIIL